MTVEFTASSHRSLDCPVSAVRFGISTMPQRYGGAFPPQHTMGESGCACRRFTSYASSVCSSTAIVPYWRRPSLERLHGGLPFIAVGRHVRTLVVVPLHEPDNGIAGPHGYRPKLGNLALHPSVQPLQFAVGPEVAYARQYLTYLQSHSIFRTPTPPSGLGLIGVDPRTMIRRDTAAWHGL